MPFYGRRKTRKLSPVRQELFDKKLPEILFSLDNIKDGSIFESKPLKGRESLYLDIGFGAGESLYKRAQENPNVGFIGVEPFVNGVANLLSFAKELSIENISLFMEDVENLLPHFEDEIFDKIFILFPDPWNKERHKKRRLLRDEMFSHINRIAKPGCEMIFSTDHDDYAKQIKKVLQSNNANYKLSKSHPEDWVSTKYERKALSQNKDINYFTIKKP